MWLATHYEDSFRADPNWKLDAFMEVIKRDLNFEITKRMAYGAKANAQDKVLGDQDKQYYRTRDYLQTLLNKNPRSILVLTKMPNPKLENAFILCSMVCF